MRWMVLALGLVGCTGDEESGETGDTEDVVEYRLFGLDADGALYDVPRDGTAATSIATVDVDHVTKIAVERASGTVYVLRVDGTTAELRTLDPCDGTTSRATTLTFPSTFGGAAEGLSFDDDTLYVAWGANAFDSNQLGVVDPTSGEVATGQTVTGTVQGELDDLAFVDGTLYARDGDGTDPSVLFTIAPGTGVATEVDAMTLVHPRGFGVAPDDGTVYVAEADGQLYTLDLATAAVSALGSDTSHVWIELEVLPACE